ncbi:MAG: helix-turn-helix domain-containing protein [Patescibacteria group bacterium]
MNEKTLMNAGLSQDEARVYAALLEYGPQGAGELLSRLSPMKRGLLYKTLERLTERKLALQKEMRGKFQFFPESPDSLVAIAKAHAAQAGQVASDLEAALPELKTKYNLSTERPTVRFFEGKEGLRELYEDKISSGASKLTFIRTARARDYRDLFGTWFSNYLQRQTEAGMKVTALTVDDEHANHDARIDKARGVNRVWVRPEDYSAPIEIDTYGDKVQIVSFGKEVSGILIENASLALAMREILALAQAGAEANPVSHDHPTPKVDVDAATFKKRSSKKH